MFKFCTALIIGVIIATAAALCPVNGDTRVLYVTVNGDRSGFDDILMLDTAGRPVGSAINWTSVPKSVVFRKLRGMAVARDGRLFVAVALGDFSKIVSFNARLEEDCTRRFEKVIASLSRRQRFLKHPYSVVLDESRGQLFSTNQNTVSVTRFELESGSPDPSPTIHALAANRTRRGGRLSSMGVFFSQDLTVDRPGDGSTMSSVRGAALTPDRRRLLVADVDADRIHVLDAHSGMCEFSIPVPAPIQIAFPPSGFLDLDGRHPEVSQNFHALVTSKSSAVYVLAVSRPHQASGDRLPRQSFQPKVFARGFEATSGMAFDKEAGTVFIADRVSRRIVKLRFDGTVLDQFGPRLLDQPEHLLLVDCLPQGTPLPRCYEFGSYGLKYSVLCIAGWVWVGMVFATFGIWGMLRFGAISFSHVPESDSDDSGIRPYRIKR